MVDLLIHIGYHKTGTTWLQKKIFVPENNVFESLTLREYGQSTLARKFILDNEGYMLSPFDFKTETVRQELLTILKKKIDKKDKTFVLTSERLCGYFGSSGFDARMIAHRLHQVFPEAKIFVTIRRQEDFIFSAYFEYLYRGGIFGIEKYLSRNINFQTPYFSPSHFYFNPLIEEYYHLFGKENILVLPYELFRFNPRSYLSKLGNFVGKKIEVNEDELHDYVNKKRNYFTLYNFRFLNYFLYHNTHNNYSPWYHKKMKYFFKILQNLIIKTVPNKFNEKTKSDVKAYVDNWVNSRYLKSNEQLSEIIDIDLSKFGYH